MNASPQFRVSPTVLSCALIILSGLWFTAAYSFAIANRSFLLLYLGHGVNL
jgi:hypothetical protein